MTCKDCVHFKGVCEGHGLYFEDEYIKNVAFSEDVKDLCPDFKNKADFVEVVRCKDCGYYENGKDYAPYCNNVMNLFEEMKPTDYCSYGEKREGQCRFEDRMDEKEIAKIKKAIEMIDDYLREPNSIAEDWYKVLKLCRQALREKVKE